MFSDIKVKGNVDLDKARQLQSTLAILQPKFSSFMPKSFNPSGISKAKIRIYPFPKSEDCNEYYTVKNRIRYICLNSHLLERRYYSSLQYLLHGISHSFCFLKDDIAQEVFCEFVSYKILNEFLKSRGENLRRKIVRSVMKISPKDYNSYYRVGRKLDEKKRNFLLKLNAKAKSKKLSKRKERKIFYKLLKQVKTDDSKKQKLPDLEKKFKAIPV